MPTMFSIVRWEGNYPTGTVFRIMPTELSCRQGVADAIVLMTWNKTFVVLHNPNTNGSGRGETYTGANFDLVPIGFDLQGT